MPVEDLLAPLLPTWSAADGPLADVLADLDPSDLALVLGVSPGGDPWGTGVRSALEAAGFDPDELVATHEPATSVGASTVVRLPAGLHAARALVLVGLGDGTPGGLRLAGAASGRATRGRAQVVLLTPSADEAGQAAFVEGAVLGGWAPARLTNDGWVPGTTVATSIVAIDVEEDVVTRAVSRARATIIARNLANTPSNIKNPGWMARQARTAASRHGLEVRVWDEKSLAAGGFGGLLAVGGGSGTPPRLVQLGYTPEGAGADTPHVVIVGKGITFDSGGLQVKPAEGMLAMKTDMSGSAIVLAVLAACRDLAVPVKVTGLLALAENMVSGAAYRPGDVVTHFGGTTTEIGNTDAEGRIVLADALAYADAELDPDVVIDIATLTGAARVALARSMAPVYATDDDLSVQLREAGETAGETLWPFPLVRAYRRALESDVADINHIGPSVGGGSITAALFLREFVGDRRWAHLDIAGPGRSDVDSGIHGKGGTGFGARLLLRWLEGLR
ncbi:leucyl aminopeptidase family protein [Knoellia subterranea]|uniref:Probable cytosol aminopeptidase n=1 Tax=Knoellia subterranea KCTC 19937 TaxID=1385521 RepID=A0A0A0JUV5_9MICO|nr:leucyl aminopeptidase family protein [Knoellia subterranea]KGN39431.1 leucyl aminopeptidase [Knoellia subterranea KCTC 19937]